MAPRKLPTGIRKRTAKDGSVTYQCRWLDANGTRHSATFDTVRDADTFRQEQLRERRLGGTADPSGGRTRYADWHTRWMTTRQIRPSTRDRDTSHARNHILPQWGDTQLINIRRSEIGAWVNLLDSSGLSPATITKILQQFTASLGEAVQEGLIGTNPAQGVKGPEIEDAEQRFLNPSELKALEDAIANPDWGEHTPTAEQQEQARWWSLVIPFLADTGLRLGELSALRVGDVNLLSGVVRVKATATYTPSNIGLEGSDGSRREAAPKTRAGLRNVPTLTSEVAERIAEMITERGLKPDNHLWIGLRGGPIHPTNWRERIFKPAVEKAGLTGNPPVTPHTLRHTAVAHWIAVGIQPYKIARYAGHRTSSQVERLYGHLLEDDTTAERDALSAIRQAAQSPDRSVIQMPRRTASD